MPERERALPSPPRISSGIPGLDWLLHGGFIESGLYMIEGLPGAGKTILGNQLCFHHASAGERVLFVTLIAEAHGKMLEHLRPLHFFDEKLVTRSLVYLSAYRALAEKGADGLLSFVAEAVHEHKPTIMVIDGFSNVRDFLPENSPFLVFLHGLNALITTARATTFLLAPIEVGKPHPEHAVVDGLVELSRSSIGLRSVREIEVRKMRGGPHGEGRHVFTITDEGLTVFPRIESQLTPDVVPGAASDERLTFDLPILDRMLEGGLLTGSTTTLIGAPGAGKTLLGLKFLEAGLRRGERSLYFGFYEPPARLLRKADRIGMHLCSGVDEGLLEVSWTPPVEQYIDDLAGRLLASIRQRAVKRLFIDGVNGFRDVSLYPARLMSFLVTLTTLLRAQDVTVVMSEEATGAGAVPGAPLEELSAVVENIILLRYVEVDAELHRFLSIIKLRESAHDTDLREFKITARGFELAKSSEPAKALLAGTHRTRPAGAEDAAEPSSRPPSRPRRRGTGKSAKRRAR